MQPTKKPAGPIPWQVAMWWSTDYRMHEELPYSAKHPIVLPPESSTSRSHPLLGVIHLLFKMLTCMFTFTEVQRNYWIVKEWSLTKAILFRCIFKRYEGATLNGPPPPPLPEFRVKEEQTFIHTGVDFAGPLFHYLFIVDPPKAAVRYGSVFFLA